MPTVDRREGFSIRIYSSDHPPAHVYVVKAGRMVVIRIAQAPVVVREVRGMKGHDVRRAVRIVDEHRERYLDEWERVHG